MRSSARLASEEVRRFQENRAFNRNQAEQRVEQEEEEDKAEERENILIRPAQEEPSSYENEGSLPFQPEPEERN